ncbi:hypothetical protein EJ110_NYTH34785 [Nymphaea thermarum]|nr:hypothetical protein EJ110_NYTH34785 [Nymphaea thermarum]
MAGDGDGIRRSTATSGGVRRRRQRELRRGKKGKEVSIFTPTSSSRASGSAASDSLSQEEEEKPPLWSYVKVKGKLPGGGGNEKFIGSYTRVKAHLLKISRQGIQGCKKISKESLNLFKKEQEAFEKKKGTTSSGYIDIASIINDDVKDKTDDGRRTASGVQQAASVNMDSAQPLWCYVNKLGKDSGGDGNIIFSCKFCFKHFTGSYTHCKAHLLHIKGHGIRPCKEISKESMKQLRKKQDEAKTKKSSAKSSELFVPLYAIKEGEDASKKKK